MLQLLRLLCVSFSCAPRASCQQSSDAEVTLMQVTAAVVETAAVALACVHALKFKKKRKSASSFSTFPTRADFCSSSCPRVRSGFLLPSTVRSHPPPKVEKQAAGGGFGELDVHKAQILDFKSAQASLRFNIFNIPKSSFSFFLQ